MYSTEPHLVLGSHFKRCVARRLQWSMIVVMLTAIIASSTAIAQSIGETAKLGGDPRAAEVEHARQLAQSGDLETAQQILSDLLMESPDYPFALYELAIIQSWDQRYDEAVASLRRLLMLQPENTGLHSEIGRVLLWKATRRGESAVFHEAIAEFESRLNAEPADCQSRKQIGIALIELREFEQAHGCLKEAIRRCPDDEEAFRLLAESYTKGSNTSLAIASYAELISKFPKNPDTRWSLSNLLISVGNLDSATRVCNETLRQYPYHAPSRILTGKLWLWQGQLDSAARAFEFAKISSGTSPEPCLGLGEIAMRRRDFAEAMTQYRKAFRLEPGNRLAKMQLGIAKRNAGPVFLFEQSALDASEGMDHSRDFGEGRMSFSPHAEFRVWYTRWVFQQDGLEDQSRDDFSIAWSGQIAQWLSVGAQCGYSSFGQNADTDKSLLGGAASIHVTLPAAITASVTCARDPLSESFATLNGNYYSDKLGGGIGVPISSRLTFFGELSHEWRHGRFEAGYWNDYHAQWVVLGEVDDNSFRWSGMTQLSLKFSNRPYFGVDARWSIQRTQTLVVLPYWSPESFPEERLNLVLADVSLGIARLDLQAGISHVYDGSEWGFGGRGSLTVLVGHFLEIGAEARYDEIGSEVPWDGREWRGFVRAIRPW